MSGAGKWSSTVLVESHRRLGVAAKIDPNLLSWESSYISRASRRGCKRHPTPDSSRSAEHLPSNNGSGLQQDHKDSDLRDSGTYPGWE